MVETAPGVFTADTEPAAVDAAAIDRLKQAASATPLRRARLCLHGGPDDPVQEMVIAFAPGSYVRPHRHLDGSESFHLVEGELTVVYFDNAGQVRQRLRLGAPGAGRPFACRLSSPWWHTVLVHTPWVVVHEVRTGPFDPGRTEQAPWAPDPAEAAAAEAWLRRLSEVPHE